MKRYQPPKRNKKKFLWIGLVLVLVVIAISTYIIFKNQSAETDRNINYAPATEEEKQEAEENKEDIVKDQENNPDPEPGEKKAVTPIITTAGVYDNNLEVSSYVPSIFETSGICTVTVTKGSQKVTREGAGLENVSAVQCPNVLIPVSELSAGTWSVAVSYNSQAAQGASAVSTVEVK